MENASLRKIASEMHSTTGVIGHYFKNRLEMQLFAQQVFQEQILDAIAIEEAGLKGVDQVVAILQAALPVDTLRRSGWRIFVAVLGRPREKEYQSLKNRHYEQLNGLIRTALHDVTGLEKSSPESLEALAQELIAIVNGVGVSALSNRHLFPAARQKSLVDRHARAAITASLTADEV